MNEDISSENVDQKTDKTSVVAVEKPDVASVAKNNGDESGTSEKDKSQSQDGNTILKGYKDLNKLFTASSPAASEIFSLVKEITDLQKIKLKLTTEERELKKKIRPQRRKDKQIDILNEKKESVSSQEKQLIQSQLEYLKPQVVLIDERLYLLKQKLKDNTQKAKDNFRTEALKNKAQSKSYIKKNGWFIKSRILKFLNLAISGELKDKVIDLKRLAKENSDDGKKLFSSALADFLYEADEEVYILCSYDLRKPLFEAIRLTLQAWDESKDTQIEKLDLK